MLRDVVGLSCGRCWRLVVVGEALRVVAVAAIDSAASPCDAAGVSGLNALGMLSGNGAVHRRGRRSGLAVAEGIACADA